MTEESRALGYVVFRVVRDANGSCIVHDGEVTTTRREYLDQSGGWTWDPNRAVRFEDGYVAKEASAAAAADCGEECYTALLFPSRKSENEALSVRKTQERSDRASLAASKRF